PSPVEAGLPSPVEAGLPSPVEAGLPSPVEAGLPSPVEAGLPIPMDAGLPVVSPGMDLPTPAEAGLPTPSEGNLPSPFEGNLPQPMGDEAMLPVVEPGHKAPPRRRGKDELPVGDGLAGALVDGQPERGGAGAGLDLGPAASEAWDGQAGEAAPSADGVGDEYALTEGGADGAGEMELADVQARADADAPLVQIAPKRSKRLRIALAVCALAIIGGGLMQFITPWGAFGIYLISDSLNRSDHERTLVAEREKAQAEFDTDTAAAAQRALEATDRARRDMPRFSPMGAYAAYVAFMKGLRFGVEGQQKALGKQLLEEAAAREKGDMVTLAQAAQDAVDGQLARARQTVDGLSQRLPEDIDVAVLGGEIALMAKTPKPALELWTQAVGLNKSARTQFGLARAQLAAEERDKAKASARQVLKLSENHAGARTLIASILYREPGGEEEALKLLKQVTDPKGSIRGSASDEEMVAAYSIMGEIHLTRSRFSAAEESFAAALKLAPQAMQALVGNGELYYRSGRYSEALARFEAALRVNPDSIDAKIGTAKTWLSQERPKDAKELMQKTLTAGARHPLVGYWLGKSEEALGDREKAEAAYRRAIKTGSKDPRVVAAYVALAELLASQEKGAQAAEVLAAAMEKLPESPQLHNAKGDVALAAGRLSEAQQEYLAALKLDPENLGSKFKLGVTLRRGRSFDQAARYFDEVGTTDPEYPGLALERGLLYEETDQTERALEMYAEALKKAPDDLDLKLRVGSTQVISGHAKQATPLLREVLRQRPQSGEVNHFLGRALLVQRTNLAEALRLLTKATEVDPNRAEYFLYLGWAANEAGQPTVAKKALDRALELDRNLGDVYWQRGVLLQKRGATLDALEELKIALEKNPSRFEAYATMALCYQDQSDWPAAEEAWRKAIEGNGQIAEWHYRLGKILFDRGNRPQATDQMKKAIEVAEGPGSKATPAWLHDAHLLLADALRATDCKTATRSYRRVLELAPSDYAYRPDAQRALDALADCAGP
ncbi:MAG: tetratricopeptide repeat protein, partial [Deltaproteobacteria bacterium]|nr:tetratricopeptide repeat protein [Deltaproteobacteria bacterium]MBW2535858.1 tetratricopeptide repeat protein [Deltaproteobacteria bacterium]